MAEIADALGSRRRAGARLKIKPTRPFAEVARIFAAIGITPTLAKLGLPEDKLDWTAEQAVGIERLIKNNPRTIDLTAMKRLIRAAYDGDLSAAAETTMEHISMNICRSPQRSRNRGLDLKPVQEDSSSAEQWRRGHGKQPSFPLSILRLKQ